MIFIFNPGVKGPAGENGWVRVREGEEGGDKNVPAGDQLGCLVGCGRGGGGEDVSRRKVGIERRRADGVGDPGWGEGRKMRGGGGTR